MHIQVGQAAVVYGMFANALGQGVAGLTVTVDAWRVVNNGTTITKTAIATGAAATEIGDGVYAYLVSAASNSADGELVVVFQTTSSSVAQRFTPTRAVAGQWADQIDAAISTRLASASYSAPPTAATIAAEVWNAANRTLTGVSAAIANTIADHVLRRPFGSAAASANGDAKSFRSLLGAVGKLVNRVAIVNGTLTVYEADDATALGAQSVTTTAGAAPISAVDTV